MSGRAFGVKDWGRRLGVAAVVLALGAASALAAGRAKPGGHATAKNASSAPAQPIAEVGSFPTTGSMLTLWMLCHPNGSKGGVCSGPVTLTASDGQVVGSSTYSLPARRNGKGFKIPLNSAGLALLAKSYKLSATLSIGGTTSLKQYVKFSYPLIRSHLLWVAKDTTASTTFRRLTVSVPDGSKVKVTCIGVGCPYLSRSYTTLWPLNAPVHITPAFEQKALIPGAAIEVWVTEANRVGNVFTLLIRSNKKPAVTVQCLLPDAATPSPCVQP